MSTHIESEVQVLNNIFQSIPLFESPQFNIRIQNIERVHFLLLQKEDENSSRISAQNQEIDEYQIEVLSELSLLWIQAFYYLLFDWKKWAIELLRHKENVDRCLGDERRISKVVQQLERKISNTKLLATIDHNFYESSFFKIRQEELSVQINNALDSISEVIEDIQELESTRIKYQLRELEMEEEILDEIRELNNENGSIQWKIYQGNLKKVVSRRILISKLDEGINPKRTT